MRSSSVIITIVAVLVALLLLQPSSSHQTHTSITTVLTPERKTSSSCPLGFWGNPPHCNLTCNNNCKGKACDPFNGTCNYGCYVPFLQLDSYWGANCSYLCPHKCLSKEYLVLPGKCDRWTGKCRHGCEIGHWGEYCNKQCPAECDKNSNTSGLGCSQDKGLCFCKKGKWNPPTCNNSCSENCDLSNDLTCMPDTGDCILGCRWDSWDFWYGEKCTKKCKGCWNGCDRATGECTCPDGYYKPPFCHSCPQCLTCDQKTGECLSCKKSWGLDNCSKPCSPNCEDSFLDAGGLFHQSVCEIRTGKCTYGCKVGWWGEQCNETCTKNCFSSEFTGDGKSQCDQMTGACHGCAHGLTAKPGNPTINWGYWGMRCEKNCSDGCWSGTLTEPRDCDQYTGICLGCHTGRYGFNCEKNCSQHCGCNRTTGLCHGNCLSGYWGDDHCENVCGHCAHTAGASKCNVSTGFCLGSSSSSDAACASGFGGRYCNITLESATEGSDWKDALLVMTGTLVGAGLVAVSLQVWVRADEKEEEDKARLLAEAIAAEVKAERRELRHSFARMKMEEISGAAGGEAET